MIVILFVVFFQIFSDYAKIVLSCFFHALPSTWILVFKRGESYRVVAKLMYYTFGDFPFSSTLIQFRSDQFNSVHLLPASLWHEHIYTHACIYINMCGCVYTYTHTHTHTYTCRHVQTIVVYPCTESFIFSVVYF